MSKWYTVLVISEVQYFKTTCRRGKVFGSQAHPWAALLLLASSGTAEPGRQGGNLPASHPIFSRRGGGQIMSTTLLFAPRIFQSFQRLCSQLTRRFSSFFKVAQTPKQQHHCKLHLKIVNKRCEAKLFPALKD